MTILKNDVAIAVLTHAAQQLQALGVHCLVSPMPLPQGMTVTLHVGESLQAALAAEVASTRGGKVRIPPPGLLNSPRTSLSR